MLSIDYKSAALVYVVGRYETIASIEQWTVCSLNRCHEAHMWDNWQRYIEKVVFAVLLLLSNFYLVSFCDIDGNTYRSSEHYYQTMKSTETSCEKCNPKGSITGGCQTDGIPIREDWNDINLDVTLRYKFTQKKKYLLDTCDKILVGPYDSFGDVVEMAMDSITWVCVLYVCAANCRNSFIRVQFDVL